MSDAFAEQVGQLARRSVVRTARQPAKVDLPARLPAVLLSVNSAGLQSATQLPGFPTDSYLAFALAVPFMQGALFATMNAGTDLARDIETGFLNRLALTPMRGAALLAGQLGGVVALGACRPRSTSPSGSPRRALRGGRRAASPSCFVFSLLIALGFGALGAFARASHRLGRGGAGAVPRLLRLPLHLVDGVPRNLIEIDWFRTSRRSTPSRT